jgi:hypothetical protein
MYYITRDERGFHAVISETEYSPRFLSWEAADDWMKERGKKYHSQTASDSGKPFWWYGD